MFRRLLLVFFFALACAKPPLHVSLDDAAGLTKGSRVYAAGVAVGEVEAISVVGTQADVTLALRPGNTLSLRLDACAMSLPDESGAPFLPLPCGGEGRGEG